MITNIISYDSPALRYTPYIAFLLFKLCIDYLDCVMGGGGGGVIIAYLLSAVSVPIIIGNIVLCPCQLVYVDMASYIIL